MQLLKYYILKIFLLKLTYHLEGEEFLELCHVKYNICILYGFSHGHTMIILNYCLNNPKNILRLKRFCPLLSNCAPHARLWPQNRIHYGFGIHQTFNNFSISNFVMNSRLSIFCNFWFCVFSVRMFSFPLPQQLSLN